MSMDKASWASWKLDFLDAMSKDPEVQPTDFVVAFRYLQHALDGERRLIFVAQATVAAELGITERAVRMSVKRLRDLDWVTIKKVPIAKKHGTRNFYTFRQPDHRNHSAGDRDGKSNALAADHRNETVKITGTTVPPIERPYVESPTYIANPPSGDSLASADRGCDSAITASRESDDDEQDADLGLELDDDDAWLTPAFLADLYEARDGDLSAVASLPDGALEAEARLIEDIRARGGAAYLIGLLAFLTNDLELYEHVIATEMDAPGKGAKEGERLYANADRPGMMRVRSRSEKQQASRPAPPAGVQDQHFPINGHAPPPVTVGPVHQQRHSPEIRFEQPHGMVAAMQFEAAAWRQ